MKDWCRPVAHASLSLFFPPLGGLSKVEVWDHGSFQVQAKFCLKAILVVNEYGNQPLCEGVGCSCSWSLPG